MLTLSLFGCIYDPTQSSAANVSSGNGGNNNPSNKISSLQIAIDKANVGDSIDFTLGKYSEITEFGNVNVNKAVTIANFNDMKSATLQVSADGVILNGIQNTSVTTNSSLKISGSSLSSLSIAVVQSSQANASQIVSRGETVRSAQPPVVEVDNTTVTEEVSVGIANAYLTVEKFTASTHVSLDAANVQLTINDKATNIKEIKTDKIC